VGRILQKMSTFDRIAESLRASAEDFRALMEKVVARENEKQRRRRSKRLLRARKLRMRLSTAYPKLGEKWRILRDEDEKLDAKRNKRD